jgi:type II secretory pathway component PulF
MSRVLTEILTLEFGPSWEEILVLLLIMAAIIAVGVILVVKLMKKQRSGLKRCPFCAELIRAEARVCRFCRRDLAA